MVPTQDVLDARPDGGLTVDTRPGHPFRIRLAGELDYGAAPGLRTALAHVTGTDWVVDCADLTFVDSLDDVDLARDRS
jgi:anti-anti-sigma regulatory factor